MWDKAPEIRETLSSWDFDGLDFQQIMWDMWEAIVYQNTRDISLKIPDILQNQQVKDA